VKQFEKKQPDAQRRGQFTDNEAISALDASIADS